MRKAGGLSFNGRSDRVDGTGIRSPIETAWSVWFDASAMSYRISGPERAGRLGARAPVGSNPGLRQRAGALHALPGDPGHVRGVLAVAPAHPDDRRSLHLASRRHRANVVLVRVRRDREVGPVRAVVDGLPLLDLEDAVDSARQVHDTRVLVIERDATGVAPTQRLAGANDLV